MYKKQIIRAMLVVLFATTGCATSKGLLGSFVALQAVDVYQTSRISPNSGIKEGNPLFANSDGSPDMGKIILTKLLLCAVTWYLQDDEQYKELIMMNLIQSSVVGWNMSIQLNKEGDR